jgi:hypothetical protein
MLSIILCPIFQTLKSVLPSNFDWLIRHNVYSFLGIVLELATFTQNNTLVPSNPQLDKNRPRFAHNPINVGHIV